MVAAYGVEQNVLQNFATYNAQQGVNYSSLLKEVIEVGATTSQHFRCISYAFAMAGEGEAK